MAAVAIALAPEGRFDALKRFLSGGVPQMISPSGDRAAMPPELYALIKEAVELLAKGQTPVLHAESSVLTTQQAAEQLGMSRPHFIKLLDQGIMAHHRVGNQRRVNRQDVLAYARRRDEERQASLDRLTRQAVEAGLYDRNEMPEGAVDE